MTTIKNGIPGLGIALLLSSCSVQQFAVNTETKPFERGGKVWGEKMEKCGPDGWKSDFRKDYDLHLLGINVRKSNVEILKEELGTNAYTIETKSNIIVQLLTLGIVDYKIVKVIKRHS
jgi:hypothetical protein